MAVVIANIGFAQNTLPATATLPVQRTLTAADGRKMDVTILSKDAASIKVRRADGKEFTLELTKLSADDQAFLAGPTAPVAPAAPPVKRTALLLGFDETKTQLEAAGYVVTKAPTEKLKEDRAGTPVAREQTHTTLASFTDDQIKGFDLVWAYSKGQDKTVERLTKLVANCHVVVWREERDRTRELLIKNQEKPYKPYRLAPAYIKTDGNVVFYSTKSIQWDPKTKNFETLEEHPEIEGQAIAEATKLLQAQKPAK